MFVINVLELNISSTIQILENVEIKADNEKGRQYFKGSVTFMKTLNEVLDKLILEVSTKNHVCTNFSKLLDYMDITRN